LTFKNITLICKRPCKVLNSGENILCIRTGYVNEFKKYQTNICSQSLFQDRLK